MTKLVFGNQKMYMNGDNVLSFIEGLNSIDKKNHVTMFPSYLYLGLYNGVVKFGAQDVSINDNGAYTGEVSASQIKSVGASYTIVGHSERRKYHSEDSELLTKKINKLLENDITPVFCIGENLEQYEQGITLDIVSNQLDFVLAHVTNPSKLIVAYEPVWAIGTGKTPTNDEIRDTIVAIKKYISEKYYFDCVVLYGGSVSPKNIDELNEIEEVDGYLIGGSSAKIDELKYIIEKCA